MTERQKRFVDFYLQTANASEAAKLAGYSARTANRIGTENLSKPVISKAIKERLEQMASERIAQTEEVLEHLTAVLRGEESETIVTPSGKKFVIPVSEQSRLKAADMLLKVNGAFKEKLDVKVDSGQLFLQTMERVQKSIDARKSEG